MRKRPIPNALSEPSTKKEAHKHNATPKAKENKK
jgi:hypothetical protein